MAYEQRRRSALSAIGMDDSEGSWVGKIDRSPKGSLDAPILDLVTYINRTDTWFTTSSCSGRISLFLLPKGKNKGGKWMYVEHGISDVEAIYQSVQEDQEGLATFRFEPFILTVECRTLDDAFRLVSIAIQSGFKASGVTSTGKRNLVSVRGSTRLEAPVALDGKWLVHRDYLEFLVNAANQKWSENLDRILVFFEMLRNSVQS